MRGREKGGIGPVHVVYGRSTGDDADVSSNENGSV